MTNVQRTMIVPDSIVSAVRALADSFGQAAANMFMAPLAPIAVEQFDADGVLIPASPPVVTHWISSGIISDEFAAIMPYSHFDQSDPPVWVTDAYDPAAFVALAEANGVPQPPVEAIAQIMSMVDVSDQDPFAAMDRLGLAQVSDTSLSPVFEPAI